MVRQFEKASKSYRSTFQSVHASGISAGHASTYFEVGSLPH